jgi:hypothetical protein
MLLMFIQSPWQARQALAQILFPRLEAARSTSLNMIHDYKKKFLRIDTIITPLD